MNEPASKKHSLAPKEHGAYGQLGVPLLTALLMGSPSWAALSLLLAAVCVFLAHEPLVVWLGQRGTRLQSEEGPRAKRLLLFFSMAAGALGALGLSLAPQAVAVAILSALLFAALVPLILRRSEKTTVGESLAASVLASAASPVAVASGVETFAALSIWLCWSLAFIATTFAVRNTIAHHKQRPPEASLLALITLTAVALGSAFSGAVHVLAGAPLFLASWVIFLLRPRPKHLKRVGWSLLVVTLLSGLSVIWLERLRQ